MRPELADVLRLGRRLLRWGVAVARADEVPTPARLLAGHLGPEAPSLPVVSEGWALYDHVNLQGALERWTMAPGRSTTLVGLTEFQHSMFTLADLAQPAMSMHGPGDRRRGDGQAGVGPGRRHAGVCPLRPVPGE